MKGIIYIVFAVFLMVSCQDKSDELTKRTREYFNKELVHFPNNWENVLIIPGGGCPGCIASGLDFVIANKDKFAKGQDRNIVIFTGIISKKILQRRLGNKNMESLNAIIDSKNIFTVDFEEREFPMVIYLRHGKITKVESESPKSDALKTLKTKIYEKND